MRSSHHAGPRGDGQDVLRPQHVFRRYRQDIFGLWDGARLYRDLSSEEAGEALSASTASHLTKVSVGAGCVGQKLLTGAQSWPTRPPVEILFAFAPFLSVVLLAIHLMQLGQPPLPKADDHH